MIHRQTLTQHIQCKCRVLMLLLVVTVVLAWPKPGNGRDMLEESIVMKDGSVRIEYAKKDKKVAEWVTSICTKRIPEISRELGLETIHPIRIVMVPDMQGYDLSLTNLSPLISFDVDGSGNVTSGRPTSVVGSGGRLTLNNTSVTIDPGAVKQRVTLTGRSASRRVVKRSYPISLGTTQPILLTLRPVEGQPLICGIELRPQRP